MKSNRLFSFMMVAIMMFSLCIIFPVEVSVPFEASASGVDNIAARADYLYNTTWTAQATVKGWRNNYTFSKGSTYHIPYGQPVTKGKYICWGVSVDNFLSATQNASSEFYSTRSYYSGNSGSYSTYYAMDCSALASYCWGLSSRTTTSSWSSLPVTSYGKCTSANVNKIQIGDALNLAGSHIVIVSDVSYDSSGNVTKVEITEQTPPETKRSYYTASELVSKYSSYTIYRYNKRDSVTPPPNVTNPSCNCSESYAGTYIVSTNSSNLVMRSEHSTSGSVITSIPKGTEVTVTKANGSWAHVNWNGNSGYCSMSYLTKKEVSNPPKTELISPIPTISTLSSSSLKLTWKAEPNATSYRIDRRKSGADAYETIATTSDTTYTDTGLEENTKYWYRVYSISGSDRSSEKNSVSGTTYTLISPTPTISTLSSSSLKLTWKAEPNATSYRIDRRKSGADAYETIATTNDTTYTDTGLEENTKYWYRVYSVADYKSSEKNSVSGTTDKAVTNCNIKLYDNGQCLAESLVKSGTKLDEFLLPTMSKTGYEFEGWYTSENGGTKYSIGSTVPDTKELSLYTRWKKSEIKGDITSDGKVTIADAVILNKWLLAVPDAELANWKAADLCEDGRIDVFDLCLLRKMLVNN